MPTLVIPSISIPPVGEGGGGKGGQKGTGQKPRHDSPTYHGDPVDSSPGMNLLAHHVHFNPPFVVPPSQKPGGVDPVAHEGHVPTFASTSEQGTCRFDFSGTWAGPVPAHAVVIRHKPDEKLVVNATKNGGVFAQNWTVIVMILPRDNWVVAER